MLPILFGILTSLCFAVASLLAQRGYHLSPAPWGAWITIAGNTLFLLAAHFSLNPDTRLWVGENLLFVAVGLFVPGVTRVLSFRGIRTMGSSITSTIINTTPMFSTVLAILVLGERPGPLVLSGVALTVVGLITVSWIGERTSYKTIEIAYPFLCALIFSLKDITVRWGLGGGAGQPIFAAGIAALTSTVEIFLIIRWVHGERFLLPPRRVSLWFLASGLFTGGAFLFMYVAFSMEKVSVVSPLMARRIESVTWRKIAGAAMVVGGIFLLSLGKS